MTATARLTCSSSERLAPALQITHRFVGTEPLCPLTRNYNQRMKSLLEAPGDAPPIEVVELARIEKMVDPCRPPECARTLSTAQLAGGRGAGTAGDPLFSDATGGKRTSNRLIFMPLTKDFPLWK